jgi:hypothetical protein
MKCYPRARAAVRNLAQQTDHTVIESLDAILLLSLIPGRMERKWRGQDSID